MPSSTYTVPRSSFRDPDDCSNSHLQASEDFLSNYQLFPDKLFAKDVLKDKLSNHSDAESAKKFLHHLVRYQASIMYREEFFQNTGKKDYKFFVKLLKFISETDKKKFKEYLYSFIDSNLSIFDKINVNIYSFFLKIIPGTSLKRKIAKRICNIYDQSYKNKKIKKWRDSCDDLINKIYIEGDGLYGIDAPDRKKYILAACNCYDNNGIEKSHAIYKFAKVVFMLNEIRSLNDNNEKNLLEYLVRPDTPLDSLIKGLTKLKENGFFNKDVEEHTIEQTIEYLIKNPNLFQRFDKFFIGDKNFVLKVLLPINKLSISEANFRKIYKMIIEKCVDMNDNDKENFLKEIREIFNIFNDVHYDKDAIRCIDKDKLSTFINTDLQGEVINILKCARAKGNVSLRASIDYVIDTLAKSGGSSDKNSKNKCESNSSNGRGCSSEGLSRNISQMRNMK